MPQVSGKTLMRLAFVLAMIAAACSEPPAPTVDVGSGVRFLPEVADSLNDAGRYSSVVTNEAGLPVVAYFGFEEVPEEGEVVAPRPVGSPSLPGVFLATVSQEGYWTPGAIAIAEQIPNVNVAFNPAFESSVSRLGPDNVTGLQLVADGDTYHAVWGSSAGVYYATGSLDPATTTQAEASLVTRTPGIGPSIALDGAGTPWISYYTSTSSLAAVELATSNDQGDWTTEEISSASIANCSTCRTAVFAADGPVGVGVAFGAGDAVWVATHDVENAWTSFNVHGVSGGQGLSATTSADGVAFAFYDENGVSLATGAPSGPFDATSIGGVAEGTSDAEGAGTSVAVDDNGNVSVAWFDSSQGVGFATGAVDSLEPIDTANATEGGSYPSVAVSGDGSVSYLSWYDTEEQDLLAGGYGDFEDVPFAAPSPVPTERTSQTSAPPTECTTPVEGGTVTVVAEGTAFIEGDCIAAPVGEPFTIHFDNRDQGVPHNVEVFAGPDPSGELLVETDTITGPAETDYDVPALDAGEYAFNCVVHPTMTGTIQAGEGGDGGGGGGDGGGDGGGGAGSTTTVTASNVQFDTATLELPADEPSTIHFVNDDAGVPHNLAIYEDDSVVAELFQGDQITGPDEIDYSIPALEAGNYYFQCDVHPTMNGTAVAG